MTDICLGYSRLIADWRDSHDKFSFALKKNLIIYSLVDTKKNEDNKHLFNQLIHIF